MKYLLLIVFGVTVVLCAAADVRACTCDFMLRANLPVKEQVKLALRESRQFLSVRFLKLYPRKERTWSLP